VREACLKTEVQVNPSALGLQGPAGPGLVVRDGNGALIGPLLGTNGGRTGTPFEGVQVAVTETVLDGRKIAIVGNLEESPGSAEGFVNASSILYYESSDCTGTPLFNLTAPIAPTASAVVRNLSPTTKTGTTLYFPAGTSSTRVINSYSYVPTGSSCNPGDSTIALSVCCKTQSDTGEPFYGVTALDVSNFVPPYLVELQ
jgi:hypothetical protein